MGIRCTGIGTKVSGTRAPGFAGRGWLGCYPADTPRVMTLMPKPLDSPSPRRTRKWALHFLGLFVWRCSLHPGPKTNVTAPLRGRVEGGGDQGGTVTTGGQVQLALLAATSAPARPSGCGLLTWTRCRRGCHRCRRQRLGRFQGQLWKCKAHKRSRRRSRLAQRAQVLSYRLGVRPRRRSSTSASTPRQLKTQACNGTVQAPVNG